MKIGITGANGFVGGHLQNFLKLQEGIDLIPFSRDFFNKEQELIRFVAECDVIVHLAGLNRHNDANEIYRVNKLLANQLVEACEKADAQPHILFSSSTQEERDNPYGNSKREARETLETWAHKVKASFTGLIIPNVFGPFGHPYYNSVVATFCHQLSHGETPQIQNDAELKLIYVNHLVAEIFKEIKNEASQTEKMIRELKVEHQYEIMVSDLLNTLREMKEGYFQMGRIPKVSDSLTRDLFTTFLCYVDFEEVFPFKYTKHTDNRGSFVELVKVLSEGQVSFSTTVPGITRGNHFHTRKVERFSVVKGTARIQLRKSGTDEVYDFVLNGDEPAFVDMPIWHTHNITNIGDDELVTVFWINEFFDPNDPDTYFEEV